METRNQPEALRSRFPPRRRWQSLLLCSLLGAFLAEGYLRYKLFGPGRQIGVGWCRPDLFADPLLEDEYWRLHTMISGPPYVDTKNFDPLIGWTSRRFRPESYDQREPRNSTRRPLLLYGASYAGCVLPPEECFGPLVEGSDLASEFELLNYGVRGHGAGQTYLVVRETIERFAHERPVVAIALVADSDFERCVLEFRVRPKPVLTWNGSQLESREQVEPISTYLAEKGTGIRSYAWRYLLYGTSAFPDALAEALKCTRAKQAAQDELIERIVLGLRDELASRQIDYFFLLCVSPNSLQHERLHPRETLLIELFERYGIPYVHTRESTLKAQSVGSEPLFQSSGSGYHHPTQAGNKHLLECIRAGIAGRLATRR